MGLLPHHAVLISRVSLLPCLTAVSIKEEAIVAAAAIVRGGRSGHSVQLVGISVRHASPSQHPRRARRRRENTGESSRAGVKKCFSRPSGSACCPKVIHELTKPPPEFNSLDLLTTPPSNAPRETMSNFRRTPLDVGYDTVKVAFIRDVQGRETR